MRLFLLLLLLCSCHVQAKAVFAHLMVVNAQDWSISQWEHDIKLAQEAHIDAFALNIAVGDTSNASILSNAFSAASSLGYQLFFSFDYAGNGAWAEADVLNLINQYGPSSTYYHYNGQPFVSTFEGPANSADWKTIKAQTNCFFIPDWSSLDPKSALILGDADGLLNWGAWPWGPDDMNTYVDGAYIQALNGLPYLMAVSPWFFTNLPGYDKNWLWRGDNLWYDRWQEVMFVQPEFIEILTWNDFGESHYIGPLHDKEYAAFSIGDAPYNYVTDMPHDGWRLFLPYLIDTYKNNISSITQEGVVAWYRLNPTTAPCSNGGTTGNTASQLQLEFEPTAILQDKVFYSALLTSFADVIVSIGGVVQQGSWSNIPDGGIGIYHGSVAFNGEGTVAVTISRSNATIASFTDGKSITGNCEDGIQNFNAWVGSASGDTISAVTPALRIDEQVCINGTGAGDFTKLCEFSCQLGYCPIGECLCTAMGKATTKPNPLNVTGYPIAGEGAIYGGLCSFACNYGFCPETACGYAEVPLNQTTVSPFLPPACTSGTGDGILQGLCEFSCKYGYCPINSCTCNGTGVLNEPPESDGTVGKPISGDDSGLCGFACEREYCPAIACTSNSTFSNGTIVYIDPSVWIGLEMACIPPCVIVLPESSLTTATTISFPPFVTTLEVGWIGSHGFIATTTTTTLSIPDYTATVISFWNVIVNLTDDTATIYPTTSISPPAFIVTDVYPSSITATAETRTIHPPPYPWSASSEARSASAKVEAYTATATNETRRGITFTSGAASPKCSGSGCGTYCTSGGACGAACASCGGEGSDFLDPANPDAQRGTAGATTAVEVNSTSTSTIMPLNTPSCSNLAGVSIPRATASALVFEFCGAEGGREVGRAANVLVTYSDVDSDGDKAIFQIEALGTSGDEGCEDFVLDTRTCEDIFYAMVNSCSTDRDSYYGGASDQGCWEYTF